MKLYYSPATRHLIAELTKREIKERYRGSILGVWWALITPMAMLFVFTFVFGEIFQSKWQGGGNVIEFGLNLYAGLIVFWFFAEIIAKAPTLICNQPNFVKKVIFPLEILALINILSALFHFFINMAILCIGALFLKGFLPFTIILVPLAPFICIPMLLGISWILSSIGVYIKDISAIVGVIMNMLMFLSPIFYPLAAIPEKFRWLFSLNPISFIIEWVRGCVMEGIFPNEVVFGIYISLSFIIGFLGLKCFNLLRGGFADVL